MPNLIVLVSYPRRLGSRSLWPMTLTKTGGRLLGHLFENATEVRTVRKTRCFRNVFDGGVRMQQSMRGLAYAQFDDIAGRGCTKMTFEGAIKAGQAQTRLPRQVRREQFGVQSLLDKLAHADEIF